MTLQNFCRRVAAASAMTVALATLPLGLAHAGFIGSTISVEAEGPLGTAQSCSPNCFTFSTFVVGDGIETSRISFGSNLLFNVDFGANSLTLTYVGTATATIDPFQGPVFSVISGDPFGPIESVIGIVAANVFETDGKLAINFFPLTFQTGDQIVVAFAETPIPGALPLFATGLGVLGFVAHRRKRKAAAAVA